MQRKHTPDFEYTQTECEKNNVHYIERKEMTQFISIIVGTTSSRISFNEVVTLRFLFKENKYHLFSSKSCLRSKTANKQVEMAE